MRRINLIHTKVVSYLENDCCFRDYEILHRSQFRTVNKTGLHYLIEKDDNIEYHIDTAIHTFCRDGFPTIYFYI